MANRGFVRFGSPKSGKCVALKDRQLTDMVQLKVSNCVHLHPSSAFPGRSCPPHGAARFMTVRNTAGEGHNPNSRDV